MLEVHWAHSFFMVISSISPTGVKLHYNPGRIMYTGVSRSMALTLILVPGTHTSAITLFCRTQASPLNAGTFR